MSDLKIGFLHPGAMGISLAASAIDTGHTAYWVSEGRTSATRERAESHGLVEAATLKELCDLCSVIVCVCPPHAAAEVAADVINCSFRGTYADANAISPENARQIGDSMTSAGIQFVDGGIIGGPAWRPGETVLHLAGRAAKEISECFAGGPLETNVVGDEIGKASALKMCFAANTKGTAALRCAVIAAAEGLGVRNELERQWARDDPEFATQMLAMMRRVTQKAWRFAGEMEEIASTFESVGMPGGFHSSAAKVYSRLAGFKGADPLPEAEDVLARLLQSQNGDLPS